MRQYDFNPIEEIRKILDGASLSGLEKVLSASKKLTMGQKAHLATALEKIGETLINEAKEEALERARDEGAFTEYGVRFTYSPDHTRTRVDTKMVKDIYPLEDGNNEYYKKIEVDETVTINIGNPLDHDS